MTDRATCWSVTINNPTQQDMEPDLPAGWKLTGQIECGAEGTQHYQGMLTTPQTRFSAVKRVFPRAHIEIAKNKKALEKYVHKQDTRVGEVSDRVSDIPTLWDYQGTIAAKWSEDDFRAGWEAYSARQRESADIDDYALRYVDNLVSLDIEAGMRGVEFIAINPMWRSSWKKFWPAIIKRAKRNPPAEENLVE